jgi:hypothetical protein
MRSAAHFAGLAEDDPIIQAMRDAYLKPWTRFLPSADLQRAFALAWRLAPLPRTWTWHRVLCAVEPESRHRDADAVPGYLRQFLSAWNG